MGQHEVTLPTLRRTTAPRIVAAVLLMAAPALADDWADYKGDCDDIFRSAKTATLQRLKECTGLWVGYIDPSKVKPPEQQTLKEAFEALYNRSTAKSDDEGQYLAHSAADRLGVRLAVALETPKAERVEDGPKPRTAKVEDDEPTSRRKRCSPSEASAADRGKARKLVEAGIKQFKAKKRAKALALYEQALEVDSSNEDALYNVAAEYSHADRAEDAVEALTCLQDIGTPAALKRLKATRADSDFDPIRESPGYKRATGYARIKVVNSLGELGEDETDRIVKTLTKLEMKPEEVGDDKVKGRETPVIWFKSHSAATAYVVKQVVVHPGTILTPIHWETEYDLIVSWGNKIIKKDGVKQPAKDYTESADPEKQLDGLRQEQDKALREPEKVARKVDNVVATPERVEYKVESSVKRATDTVDKIEKTGEKLDKLFK